MLSAPFPVCHSDLRGWTLASLPGKLHLSRWASISVSVVALIYRRAQKRPCALGENILFTAPCSSAQRQFGEDAPLDS